MFFHAGCFNVFDFFNANSLKHQKYDVIVYVCLFKLARGPLGGGRFWLYLKGKNSPETVSFRGMDRTDLTKLVTFELLCSSLFMSFRGLNRQLMNRAVGGSHLCLVRHKKKQNALLGQKKQATEWPNRNLPPIRCPSTIQ